MGPAALGSTESSAPEAKILCEAQQGGEESGQRREHGEALWRVVGLCAQMPRTIEDLATEIGCGRSEIYRHVRGAIELELVERHDLIKGLLALLAATREGHSFTHSGLRLARIHHSVVCSQIAADLRSGYPDVEMLSESELRLRCSRGSKWRANWRGEPMDDDDECDGLPA